MGKIKQIIWDWNGTLLNDVAMCVRVMNKMLQKYSLPRLTCEKYKQIFDFPVKDYYVRLGFDFDQLPFHVVGHEFMDRYFEELPHCPLFYDTVDILKEIEQMEINQLILSAMEHNELEKSLEEKGIRTYFSRVQGIDNHLASGKTELAAELLETSGFEAQETLLIGDTLHDLEVAQSIDCHCALIASGHFSKERLLEKHDLVFDNLTEFLSFFQKSRVFRSVNM